MKRRLENSILKQKLPTQIQDILIKTQFVKNNKKTF